MRRGLTFIETVISLAIFALVATSISVILGQSLSFYRASRDRSEAVQQARNAMEWLVRDIQSAQSILTAQGDNLTVLKPDASMITYTRDSLQEIINRQNGGTNLLAEDVIGFSLRYYDINNVDLGLPVPGPSLPNIKTVEIDITIQRDAEQFRLYTVAGLGVELQ